MLSNATGRLPIILPIIMDIKDAPIQTDIKKEKKQKVPKKSELFF